jgi:hypothetical protein
VIAGAERGEADRPTHDHEQRDIGVALSAGEIHGRKIGEPETRDVGYRDREGDHRGVRDPEADAVRASPSHAGHRRSLSAINLIFGREFGVVREVLSLRTQAMGVGSGNRNVVHRDIL